jgi:sterol desaturase/sphingolipid hydroxylase (fatty acid hydroxylase superfamily)
MLANIQQQLHDPVGYAIPVFLLLIVIELIALRQSGADRRDHGSGRPRGYASADTWTSLTMGLVGSGLAIVFRAVSLLGFAAIYVYLAPWHLPSDAWWTWALLLLGVDLLWYWYHRLSHRVRLVWAAHQAHHSSEYFNY